MDKNPTNKNRSSNFINLCSTRHHAYFNLIAFLFAPFLTACAGPMLNEYTLYLGPSIGSVEERQVLTNIGRFLDNPWAIPGHVELANGQIQVTNQLGVNLKYPFSTAYAGSTLTHVVATTITKGQEYDINPAQT
jgi:hypothetical protein